MDSEKRLGVALESEITGEEQVAHDRAIEGAAVPVAGCSRAAESELLHAPTPREEPSEAGERAVRVRGVRFDVRLRRAPVVALC